MADLNVTVHTGVPMYVGVPATEFVLVFHKCHRSINEGNIHTANTVTYYIWLITQDYLPSVPT